MTDDSLPIVPSSSSSSSSSSEDKKSSSWDFNELNDEDASNNSNDFFSVLKKTVAKHVYFNGEIESDNYLCNKMTEQSTVRVDSSDLISRCKNFLPLLTDANRTLFSKMKSGENVRIEIDSDQDDKNDRTAIEMNLMFCPNVDISDLEDTSDESDDDRARQIRLSSFKKKNPINIIEIQSTNNMQDKNSEETGKT